MNKLTLQQIEQALDEGRVVARMTNGNRWSVRRNGKTKTWKTRPDEFRIPIKVGFRTCSEINERTVVERIGGGNMERLEI